MQKDNEARVCDNKILEQVSVAHKSLTVQLPGLCFIRMLWTLKKIDLVKSLLKIYQIAIIQYSWFMLVQKMLTNILYW